MDEQLKYLLAYLAAAALLAALRYLWKRRSVKALPIAEEARESPQATAEAAGPAPEAPEDAAMPGEGQDPDPETIAAIAAAIACIWEGPAGFVVRRVRRAFRR